MPGPIAAACSAAVANTRTSTALPASTNAGKPRTVWPPLTRSTVRGSSSRSSGQLRSPRSFQPVGDRFRDGLPRRRGQLLLQRLEVLAAGDLGAVRGLDGERHPQVRRQLVEVEGVDRHEHTGAPLQRPLQ